WRHRPTPYSRCNSARSRCSSGVASSSLPTRRSAPAPSSKRPLTSPTPTSSPRSHAVSARQCAARRSVPSTSSSPTAAGSDRSHGVGMKIGVLALQGAFREQAEAFDALGAEVALVKAPEQLAGVDAVVLPGGESTTVDKLLDSSGLRTPLRDVLRDGMPALAVCAGLIVLAAEVVDGRADQQPLGVVDVTVRRNGYGRQRDSFEADLEIAELPNGSF